MASVTLNALLTPGFPVAVLFGGDHLPSHATGRAAAIRQPIGGTQDTPEPMNRRWFRYKTIAVAEYRNWLTFVGHWAAEKHLTLDFLFPVAHGGTLAGSLWWVWATLGHPFHPAWIAAPLAVILTADWTEKAASFGVVWDSSARVSGLTVPDRISRMIESYRPPSPKSCRRPSWKPS